MRLQSEKPSSPAAQGHDSRCRCLLARGGDDGRAAEGGHMTLLGVRLSPRSV